VKQTAGQSAPFALAGFSVLSALSNSLFLPFRTFYDKKVWLFNSFFIPLQPKSMNGIKLKHK